jgi:hypothetical protein
VLPLGIKPPVIRDCLVRRSGWSGRIRELQELHVQSTSHEHGRDLDDWFEAEREFTKNSE